MFARDEMEQNNLLIKVSGIIPPENDLKKGRNMYRILNEIIRHNRIVVMVLKNKVQLKLSTKP
jgi:hypothetical protein